MGRTTKDANAPFKFAVGDFVTYTVGKRVGESVGYIDRVRVANVAMLDLVHYGTRDIKELYVQRDNVIGLYEFKDEAEKNNFATRVTEFIEAREAAKASKKKPGKEDAKAKTAEAISKSGNSPVEAAVETAEVAPETVEVPAETAEVAAEVATETAEVVAEVATETAEVSAEIAEVPTEVAAETAEVAAEVTTGTAEVSAETAEVSTEVATETAEVVAEVATETAEVAAEPDPEPATIRGMWQIFKDIDVSALRTVDGDGLPEEVVDAHGMLVSKIETSISSKMHGAVSDDDAMKLMAQVQILKLNLTCTSVDDLARQVSDAAKEFTSLIGKLAKRIKKSDLPAAAD